MMASHLQHLYRELYRIRRVEEVIADFYPRQQMRCPVHLSIGQEAIAVGVCAALQPADHVFSTHRSHGHYLAKGGSLKAMLAELHGRASGCSAGKGGSMHMIDLDAGVIGAAPILGGTIALAVGAAFGHAMQNTGTVTAAFFGDGAAEEGIFYEAVNFAALKRLPVLMICENNALSMCSKFDVRQPEGRSLADLARAIGVTSHSGDGNDVLEVVRLSQEAATRAREGHGPTFLELRTDRWREHCGPGYDFFLGYRPESELKSFHARCPLRRLRREMERTNAWDERWAMTMMREVNTEIDRAMESALASPFPDQEQLFDHEYALRGASSSRRDGRQ